MLAIHIKKKKEGVSTTALMLNDVEIPLKIRKPLPPKLGIEAPKNYLLRGGAVMVPLRIAVTLIEDGYAEVELESLYSVPELKKIRWKEEKSSNIQRFEKGFYLKVRLLIQLLEIRLKSENMEEDEWILQAINSTKITAVDILRRRLQKIVNLVFSNATPSRKVMDLLTIEEKQLYISLCETIGDWNRTMMNYMEKGDVLRQNQL